MPFAMSLFSTAEWGVLLLWFAAILSPIIYALRTQTSLAMGITVSVLLGAVVQVLWSLLFSWGVGLLLGVERFCPCARPKHFT